MLTYRLLRWLGDRLLGPRCPYCGERWYGPRTMEKHFLSDHAGDDL